MYDGGESGPENDAPHCSNLSAPVAFQVALGHEAGQTMGVAIKHQSEIVIFPYGSEW